MDMANPNIFEWQLIQNIFFWSFLLQGTIKILSQIGQDTAITEQQISVVKNQLEKIEHLKKVCYVSK